jgi:putative DNA primase/helicase
MTDYLSLAFAGCVIFCALIARDDGPGVRLKVRNLAQILPERIKWLWNRRIPKGKLTLVVGTPDSGKSLFVKMVASLVSTGATWPDGAENGEPGRVLFLSAEDDASDTILPRLQNFGADLSMIEIIDGTFFEDTPDKERDFMLDKLGIEALAVHAEHTGTKLLIIDTISHFFGPDLNKAQEAKQAMKPLIEYAARYGASILGIEHMGKDRNRDPLARVMGSTGIAGQSRCCWGFAKDPDDPDRIRMIRLKGNLSKCTGGLAFRCESVPDSDHPICTWEDESCLDSPYEVFGPVKFNQKQEDLDEACRFLKDELGIGVLEANELYSRGEERGLKKRLLQKAATALKVKKDKNGFQGKWQWSLPKNTAQNADSLDSLEPF